MAMAFQEETQPGLEPVTFSDLEFNPNAHADESAHPKQWDSKRAPQFYPSGYSKEPHHELPANANERSGRICGLRRNLFLCLVVVTSIVIIAAAVIGGVMGYENSKDWSVAVPAPSSMAPAVAVSTSIIPSTASTTSSAPLSTTTLEVTPTHVYTSDCPSSDDTVYSITLNSKTLQYRKLCGMAVFNADPDNKSNIITNTNDLNQCIDQCATQPENGGLPCNAVCWRTNAPSPDKAGIGSCFGYVTANTTSNNFNGNATAGYCDGAVFIGES